MQFRARLLADAIGADLRGPDRLLDGATTDSRAVTPGSLFVPIVAERDGHDFIPEALAAGAGAYLCRRGTDPGSAIDGRSPTSDVAVLEVADTGEALLAAGSFARSTLGDRRVEVVIGITGSVGKTSTKDLVAAACRRARPTHANPSSFNNELGLPLTLLNAPDDSEILVLEMGARGIGHVAELCKVARPTIGMVTRVALAHGEQFGSVEAVAKAKGEMVEALNESGVAVLNADDAQVAAMAARTTARVLTYGLGAAGVTPDVLLRGLELDAQLRPRFVLDTPEGVIEATLAARGAHMAHNAAAAVAAALAAGIDLAAAVEGLADAAVTQWRMDVGTTPSGAVVINDAYNANPTSMKAALDALVSLRVDRRIAVLGAMAELGPESVAHHREVADAFVGSGVRVVAVDAADYGPDVEHVGPGIDDVLAAIGPLGQGDGVLVKASRSVGLEAVAHVLLGDGNNP